MTKRWLIGTALVCTLLAAPVMGQLVPDSGEEAVRMDNLPKVETDRPIFEYVLAGAFLFGVLGLSFMNSKRAQAE